MRDWLMQSPAPTEMVGYFRFPHLVKSVGASSQIPTAARSLAEAGKKHLKENETRTRSMKEIPTLEATLERMKTLTNKICS
jgi:hypothetical protein